MYSMGNFYYCQEEDLENIIDKTNKMSQYKFKQLTRKKYRETKVGEE
jgi:hypothetical protein